MNPIYSLVTIEDEETALGGVMSVSSGPSVIGIVAVVVLLIAIAGLVIYLVKCHGYIKKIQYYQSKYQCNTEKLPRLRLSMLSQICEAIEAQVVADMF